MPAKEKKPASEPAVSSTLYQNLDLFTKVLNHVQQDYVETPEEQELIYGAIEGMLKALDPHSLFLSPDVYRELKVDTEGRFGGIGIEITVKDNFLTVVSPIEGTPAEKAGIQSGDRIIKINGKSTKGLGLTDAVKLMRGKRGSRVRLVIQREGQSEPMEFTLERRVIRVPSVRYERPEDGYGYIRVSSFQEQTGKDLRGAMRKLSKNGPLKGLILDLRNNPGGLLDQAIEVSDVFLGSGVIVTTQSRDKVIDTREAHEKGTYADVPVIVLVNGGSASAAEIVAGALQDHQRAIVLGTETFGKGSVQTVYDLGGGSALKLTVAHYFTPQGRSIQAEGIKPDIVVENRPGAEPKVGGRYLREKDLKGHLENPQERKGIGDRNQSGASGTDYQKDMALDYLRSWAVFGKQN